MLTQAALFILDTLLGLFVLAVLVRFYLQLMRAPFRNPVSQFVAALTDFAVKPLRRVIPGLWGLDLASLVLAWLVEWLMLLGELWLGGIPVLTPGGFSLLALAALALVKLLRLSIYILIGAVLLQAILSWVNPHTPLAPVLNSLTRPFLRPVQKLVPPVANVDLSPLVLFFLCELALMLPVAWLETIALRLF
jgi:YggT family protein